MILKKILADLDAPVVLGIDLNEGPDGPAWRTVADGLTDVGERDGTRTFPARNPQRRIDAIFVDPRCAVVDFRVLDVPGAPVASDHLALLVDLELPGA
jgi:endonuclease/exonuclease/phosphatase family metal-dependent hydrolase